QRIPLTPAFSGDHHASPGCFADPNRPSPEASADSNNRDLCQSRPNWVAKAGSALARRCPMKTLRAHLDEYLNLRHKLGFKFLTAGRLLGGFVAFAEGKKASFITRKLALAWATQPAGCQPA